VRTAVTDPKPAWQSFSRRGYSEADVHKILGANALRAFRQADQIAKRLRATTRPEVDEIKREPRGY
jgi:membrane dipeptidase